MGFWIFMLIMDLLLPFTMIGFGRYFMKKAPKEINSVFGYRTSMSMKNKDTWEFAHKYCGKVWYVCGMVMLPITVIFMLLVIGILLGIPDADIYCFDDGRIHLCEYEETESYRVTEMFINNRQMLLDKLLTD